MLTISFARSGRVVGEMSINVQPMHDLYESTDDYGLALVRSSLLMAVWRARPFPRLVFYSTAFKPPGAGKSCYETTKFCTPVVRIQKRRWLF